MLSPTVPSNGSSFPAPQLKLSEDRLSVTGEKGYCMLRATHGKLAGRDCFSSLRQAMGVQFLKGERVSKRSTNYRNCELMCVGDVVVQWLVCRTWDLKVESLSPDRCTHVVFLGKTLNSHSASLHPGV